MSSRRSQTQTRLASAGAADPHSARARHGGAARERSSRDAFVKTTARLLRRQGYAATGLNEIVAASGAPRGSLYHHFPGGKEQLAIAAMRGAGAQLADGIDAVLASSENLGVALGRLVDGLAAGLEASGFADGCPVATVALEAAGTSEPIRDAAREAFDSWLRALRKRLMYAGYGEQDARRRAMLLLAAIEGALILARAQRDVAPLASVREELVALCA
jgi:TetR/AcrR family transcriptional repressor of lmrAB and yxaGH operons